MIYGNKNTFQKLVMMSFYDYNAKKCGNLIVME